MSFKTILHEQFEEPQQLDELALPFGLDIALANIARKSGLTAVTNVLTDVFETGIRLVGKNPLKTAFFILALDIFVNEGRGRDALIRYLNGSFVEHAGFVIDSILSLMENGISAEAATEMVSAAIEASN